MNVWYLRVLLKAEELFQMGLEQVAHLQKVGYYRAFFHPDSGKLQLPSADAAERKRKRELPLAGMSEMMADEGASTVRDHARDDDTAATVGLAHKQPRVSNLNLEQRRAQAAAAAPPSSGAESQVPVPPDEDDIPLVSLAQPDTSVRRSRRREVGEDGRGGQAGQSESFAYQNPAGSSFHFIYRSGKAGPALGDSRQGGSAGWHCTCHYHTPEQKRGKQATYCTSSLTISSAMTSEKVIAFLKEWADKAEQFESKQHHQKEAANMRHGLNTAGRGRKGKAAARVASDSHPVHPAGTGASSSTSVAHADPPVQAEAEAAQSSSDSSSDSSSTSTSSSSSS